MTSIMPDNDSTHNTSLEKQNEKCLDRLLTPIFRVNSEESLARNRKFLKVIGIIIKINSARNVYYRHFIVEPNIFHFLCCVT